MFKVYRKELEWGGRTLVLETGKIARQADAAVVATYGDTTVLCTVVGEKSVRPGIDFFPLTVHYQEKAFAAGRIPGGFFKREGKPSEKEVLTSRLIDRPLRPLFLSGFYNEVQVLCTVLSYDLENDSDIVALIGASAALTLSGMPFMGPVGAARVGYKNGQYVLNPALNEMDSTELDLVVAGTQEGVLMVESEAKELPEDIMLGAVMFGHQAYQPVLDAIIQMAETCAKDVWAFDPDAAKLPKEQHSKLAELVGEGLRDAYKEIKKQDRQGKIKLTKDAAMAALQETFGAENIDTMKAASAFKALEQDIVRGGILDTAKRIDGRGCADIRNIEAEVGILPRAHGSALFTRGETQALVVATLGTGEDEQIMDALGGEYRENFLLHYNFPPYSVGETGRVGAPGRREVGHGKLAWRSIHAVLPGKDQFPYTIRVVSEITESNGSSSMATVCGSSLSLMDAGVPLPRPVAGIAMGLIKEGERFAVLSDILGDEDHLGDMDFKVAGTANGITALQMDIKITSITEAIMRQALGQAKDGRLHILGKMEMAMTTARSGVSTHAPRIHTLKINKDRIRDVIGSGGKVIREICEISGAKIDIEEDGTIRVAAVGEESINEAVRRIMAVASDPEIGQIYDGTVTRLLEFGAIVQFFGAKDGMVHISEMRPERVAKVTDVVRVGQAVRVKLVTIEGGKMKLSMKNIPQLAGADDAAPQEVLTA